MYYTAIGLLAIIILLIENQDILFKQDRSFDGPSWRVYRRFLFSVLAYYITDALWGTIEYFKLRGLLFFDTTIYFIAMAAGIILWSTYVRSYLEDESRIGRGIVYAGRGVALLVTAATLINVFVPVLFSVDENCVYVALPLRYVLLVCQILLLLVISIYAFSAFAIIKRRNDGQQTELSLDSGIAARIARRIDPQTNTPQISAKRQRFKTIGLFGIVMALFLTIQIWFPYLPLYGIAYMLGTCLLRTYVIADEKNKLQSELEAANKVAALQQQITTLLDNMPALTFYKDAETGIYLACNQAFAEYVHKKSPEDVIGLKDNDLFDEEMARHFAEDDRIAMSMNEPYIFFEDIPDLDGNQRQFQTTKLIFTDASGKRCLLGMGQDVTDLVRIRRENATTLEAYEQARSLGLISSHIARALAKGFRELYYINVETGDFIVYRTNEETGLLEEVRKGGGFFESCQVEVHIFVYSEDREAFSKAMVRETLLKETERSKTFSMTYRILVEGEPLYVRMKASRMEDDDRYLVLGVADVDAEMKQRRENDRIKEEHMAYNRLNALTGDLLGVYIIAPETGRYREYSSEPKFANFEMPKSGPDFLEDFRTRGRKYVYAEDRERFLNAFTYETIYKEIETNGLFTLSCRMLLGEQPSYVQIKAAIVEEQEGKRVIVGVNDIELLVRQEQDFARRLSHARKMATVDALTGVKTKHAYLDLEERLNSEIEAGLSPEFAVIILDINDLKLVNDTQGHQAGDKYIKDACMIICQTFKHSPVYRVGGDEFAVVSQGEDYSRIDELVESIHIHNREAAESGGIVIACGMSKYTGDPSVAAVYERADHLMYTNKTTLKDGRTAR